MYAEPTGTTAIPSQPAQPIQPDAQPQLAGWDAGQDCFFRLTATLFSPAFTSGAGVLLASYDEE